MLPVEVVEVADRRTFRAFCELPLRIYGTVPHVRAALPAERRRLSPERNPYFAGGDAAYFLARRHGEPAGRIAAHLAGTGEPEGRFGFLLTGGEADVTRALLAEAARWLREKGCRTMTGPLSFQLDDGAGVLVGGDWGAPVTARPWTPPGDGTLLEACGLTSADELPTYAVPTVDGPVTAAASALAVPFGLEPYADPALQLRTVDGAIVAVPDVAPALAAVGLRGAWGLARRARRRDWTTAVVTAVEGPPAALVGALLAAAGAAGYRAVLGPWTPDPGATAAMVHRLYRQDL